MARYHKDDLERIDGNSAIRNVTRRLESRYQKAVKEKVGLAIGMFGLPVIGLMMLLSIWIPKLRKAVFLKKVGLIYFCITTLSMIRLAATLWDLS